MGGVLGASTLPKHELYPLLTLTRPRTRGDRSTNSSRAKAMEQETGTAHRRLIGGLRGEKMHAPSMINHASILDVFYMIFFNQRDECECLALVLPRVQSLFVLSFSLFLFFYFFYFYCYVFFVYYYLFL